MIKFLKEIPKDLFSNLQQIGAGAYSKIYSAIYKKTNTKVALKISLKSEESDIMKVIEQETKIHKSLHHPFICKFFFDVDTPHLKIICMELIEGENGLEFLNENKSLASVGVRHIFAQLVIAIDYLHNEKNISHRDLKLENIMIDKYGHIRLIDFGFCSEKVSMSTICGSVPYIDPEVLLGKPYSKAADVWSIGIILYALIFQQFPFYDQDIIKMSKMICENPVKFPTRFDPLLKDLILRMLDKNSETRFKIEDVKNHPFLAQEKIMSVDFKALFTGPNILNPPTITPQEAINNWNSFSCVRINRFGLNKSALGCNQKRRYMGSILPSLDANTKLPEKAESDGDVENCIEIQDNYAALLNNEILSAMNVQRNVNSPTSSNRHPFFEVPQSRRCSQNNVYTRNFVMRPIIMPNCRVQTNIINNVFNNK